MVKCPYCKSTAQVKLNGFATLSDNRQYLIMGAECGCGCHFRIDFNIDDYEESEILYIE